MAVWNTNSKVKLATFGKCVECLPLLAEQLQIFNIVSCVHITIAMFSKLEENFQLVFSDSVFVELRIGQHLNFTVFLPDIVLNPNVEFTQATRI